MENVLTFLAQKQQQRKRRRLSRRLYLRRVTHLAFRVTYTAFQVREQQQYTNADYHDDFISRE
jgi:hypothetical protein